MKLVALILAVFLSGCVVMICPIQKVPVKAESGHPLGTFGVPWIIDGAPMDSIMTVMPHDTVLYEPLLPDSSLKSWLNLGLHT